jgi:hypothetical protein
MLLLPKNPCLFSPNLLPLLLSSTCLYIISLLNALVRLYFSPGLLISPRGFFYGLHSDLSVLVFLPFLASLFCALPVSPYLFLTPFLNFPTTGTKNKHKNKAFGCLFSRQVLTPTSTKIHSLFTIRP